ncbi:MAG TPA: 30S ribosomal protein S20 [Acidobacteriota bacterium]
MANHPSALKRARQNEARRERNRQRRTRLRNQIKSLRDALSKKNRDQAQELLRPTLSLIDRMSSSGLIHTNTAARTKSRLSRQVQALAK